MQTKSFWVKNGIRIKSVLWGTNHSSLPKNIYKHSNADTFYICRKGKYHGSFKTLEGAKEHMIKLDL